MADPLIRQWELLKLIPRDRRITVRELKDKLNNLGFSVTCRAIELDLERLSVPFCLESDERIRPYGWRFSPHAKSTSIPGLHSEEALTFLLLETHLKNLLPIAIAESLKGQFSAAQHYFEQELPDSKLCDWLKKFKVVSPGQPLLPAMVLRASAYRQRCLTPWFST